LRRLQYVLGSERAKVGLMQSRDKIDAYRKELDSYTQRLMTEDSSGVRRLLEYRRETFVLIESEEQVARNWIELAHQPDTEAKGLSSSKGARSHTVAPAMPNTPGNAEEHRKRGAALNDQGQYDEAIREFQIALKLVPTLVRAHLGLGAAKQGKGDLEGAIAEYRTVLRVQPHDSDAHNNLGTVLQQKGDMEGAIAEYRLALQGQPDDPLIHFNLGTALSVKGVEEQALTEYRTTVRLRPDFAPAYFYLGTILKQRRQMREAAEAFRNYLKLAQTTTDQEKWIEEAQRFLLEKDERKPRPDR
jgi:tetratricopeptide (TPR) repeat protein